MRWHDELNIINDKTGQFVASRFNNLLAIAFPSFVSDDFNRDTNSTGYSEPWSILILKTDVCCIDIYSMENLIYWSNHRWTNLFPLSIFQGVR